MSTTLVAMSDTAGWFLTVLVGLAGLSIAGSIICGIFAGVGWMIGGLLGKGYSPEAPGADEVNGMIGGCIGTIVCLAGFIIYLIRAGPASRW